MAAGKKALWYVLFVNASAAHIAALPYMSYMLCAGHSHGQSVTKAGRGCAIYLSMMLSSATILACLAGTCLTMVKLLKELQTQMLQTVTKNRIECQLRLVRT